MAQDPAFLFYPGDASEDTQFMNRLERGCYFDILKAQKKFGKFSIEQIKKVLGADFESCWPSLELVLKFENGFYFIEWVAEKILERKAFSESRRKNRTKKDKSVTSDGDILNTSLSSDDDMVIEDGDGNEEEIKIGDGFFLSDLPMETELTKVEIINVQEFIKISCKEKIISEDEVKRRWQAFKIDNFKKREWQNAYEDVLSFFRHSLKNELNKQNGHTATTKINKPGTSEARTERAKTW